MTSSSSSDEVRNLDGATGMIKERIAVMIAMRRARRRRVQIPLFCTAALLFAIGIAAAFIAGFANTFRLDAMWGFSPLFAGAAVIAIAAMPGDANLLRSLLCAVAILSLIVTINGAPFDVGELKSALESRRGSTRPLAPADSVQLVFAAVGALMISVLIAPLLALRSLYLLVGSFWGVFSALRLPILVVRTLSAMFASAGVAYALIMVATILSTRMPDERAPYFVMNGLAARTERAWAYGWLCMQCLAMGLTGLLKHDLCSRVHGFLAIRGVGMDAAAGIAEMLNGVKASHVLEQAASSFRVVSLDGLSADCFAVPRAHTSSRASSSPVESDRAPPRSSMLLSDRDSAGVHFERDSSALPVSDGVLDNSE